MERSQYDCDKTDGVAYNYSLEEDEKLYDYVSNKVDYHMSSTYREIYKMYIEQTTPISC